MFPKQHKSLQDNVIFIFLYFYRISTINPSDFWINNNWITLNYWRIIIFRWIIIIIFRWLIICRRCIISRRPIISRRHIISGRLNNNNNNLSIRSTIIICVIAIIHSTRIICFIQQLCSTIICTKCCPALICFKQCLDHSYLRMVTSLPSNNKLITLKIESINLWSSASGKSIKSSCRSSTKYKNKLSKIMNNYLCKI